MMSFRGRIVSVFLREADGSTELVMIFLGRDPDARPPKGIVQNLTYGIWSVWRFFRTNEAVVSAISGCFFCMLILGWQFALKYTIVTIALWLPQVLKSSAGALMCSMYYGGR
jgi:hypothetical protein